MFDLIIRFREALEPQTTAAVKERFGLLEKQAEIVVPVVGTYLLRELRHYLMEPEPHQEILLRLQHFLLATEETQGEGPEEVNQAALVMGDELLGGKLGVIAHILMSVTGVEEEQGAQIIRHVVPLILSALRRDAGERGLLGVLGPIVANSGNDKIDLIRHVLETGSSRSAVAHHPPKPSRSLPVSNDT
ncbi:MAG: hypothetical protein ACE5G0_22190 [Rhodothermales bacterium]